MKVALLADRLWLHHESSLFRHLVVALADEGVRAVPVVPAGMLREQLMLVADRVDYGTSGYPLLRDLRVRRLAKPLRERGLDLIHVLDGSLARVGKSLAASVGVPVMLSCWNMDEVELMARLAIADSGVTLVVPTSGMMSQLRRIGGADVQVEQVPPGVIGSRQVPEPLRDPGASVCCLVIADGRGNGGLGTLLAGAARLKNEMPQLQMFLYPVEESTHKMWQTAAKADALGMVNLVGPEDMARNLLVQADAVICPGATGCVRTLILSAMAAGRPVFATPDAALDYVIDGQTAQLVQRTGAGDWAELLRSLVVRPDTKRELGARAREYVREHHGVTGYLNRLMEVYRRVSGEPLKFEG